jgi:alpha-beta hydrolase superfamily lysophospholipase
LAYIERHIKSADGTSLFLRVWKPDTKAKLVICMVHGIGEHSGRYINWAKMFNQADIAFSAIDYRGQGNAEGKRGHSPSFAKLFDDITVFLAETDYHLPEIPKILYGHNLGGNIVLNYYFKKYPQINGLIVSSPWLKLTTPPRTLRLIAAKFLKYFLPSLTVNNGIDLKHLSRNPEILKQWSEDQMVHQMISLKLYFETTDKAKSVLGLSYKIRHPLLLMHGSADKITSVKGTTQFSRNTGMYTTYKIWDGCFHELHNEPNNKEIFEYILKWLHNNFQQFY